MQRRTTKHLPPPGSPCHAPRVPCLRRVSLTAGAGALALSTPKLLGLASGLLARGLSLLAPTLLPRTLLPPWPSPGLPF